nr:immunoglobulin heavy chain junction region [Macaca mulatta]MOX64401.1 immunoglobulin heavy chain junction region [Macaca mulatta]
CVTVGSYHYFDYW